MINPEKDGVDHINVYSKGRTELGRFLSNFSHTPIDTEDSHFESIEGYWYWLGCGEDSLRRLWGYDAKKRGRELRSPDWQDSDNFKEKIKAAIKSKIITNEYYSMEFIMSTLPFAHYYVFDGMVSQPKDGKWVIEYLEELRESLYPR